MTQGFPTPGPAPVGLTYSSWAETELPKSITCVPLVVSGKRQALVFEIRIKFYLGTPPAVGRI